MDSSSHSAREMQSEQEFRPFNNRADRFRFLGWTSRSVCHHTSSTANYVVVVNFLDSIFNILWHDYWKQTQRSQNRHSLLGNDSVNTFPRERIRKQQSNNFRCYATAFWTHLLTIVRMCFLRGLCKEFIWEVVVELSRVSRHQPTEIWAWE
jgi:hypothetical protein